MKNEHRVSMVKLAHTLAGIAPREPQEAQPETGAASIRVELSKGTITVKHGDTGEVLLTRPVARGWWSFTLWPTLDGRRS
jgi:hypothetical protein